MVFFMRESQQKSIIEMRITGFISIQFITNSLFEALHVPFVFTRLDPIKNCKIYNESEITEDIASRELIVLSQPLSPANLP